MAEASSDATKGHLKWTDICTKLLEQAEDKNYSAQDLKGKANDLLKKKEKLEKEIKIIEEEIEKASKQLKELGNDDDKPIRSSLLKLYSLITKLTFDIENPTNEPKGYVAGNSVENFLFDTTKHSQQFIIDSLWELIVVHSKQKGVKRHTDVDCLMNSLDSEKIKRQKLV